MKLPLAVLFIPPPLLSLSLTLSSLACSLKTSYPCGVCVSYVYALPLSVCPLPLDLLLTLNCLSGSINFPFFFVRHCPFNSLHSSKLFCPAVDTNRSKHAV